MKQVVFGDNCPSLLVDANYITPFGNFKEDVVAADVMCSIRILCNPFENNPRDLYHPLLPTLLTLTVIWLKCPNLCTSHHSASVDGGNVTLEAIVLLIRIC